MGFFTPEQGGKFKTPVAHTRLIKVESPSPETLDAFMLGEPLPPPPGLDTDTKIFIKNFSKVLKIFLFSFLEKYVLLKAKFKVSRTLSFYLYRIYLPAICLVILSWANFWIPAKAVPARITMVVTNFLATVFILQGAAGQLAKREDPTAMEYFLVINVIFVLAVMVEYLLVLNYKPGKWFKVSI